jgi:hypothetical protein
VFGPGVVDILVCDDHDETGVCSVCDRRPVALAILGCSVCKNYHAITPRTLVMHHPAVISFFYERGIELGYRRGDVDRTRRWERLRNRNEQTVVSTDPPRVEVTVRHKGDELRLMMDENAEVVAVEESTD